MNSIGDGEGTVSASSSSVSSNSTSPSLLDLIRDNDQEAWQRLTALYGPLVYQWCHRWHLQSADIADIFQEVFRAVATNINSFQRDQAGATFRGWLWTICRNKLADHFRRRAQEPDALGGTEARQRMEQLPDAEPEPGPVGNLPRRALELIRNDFEDRTWQAFFQTAIEKRSPSDVAANLGMSVQAVYKAKSRVLHRIRQELSGLIDFQTKP